MANGRACVWISRSPGSGGYPGATNEHLGVVYFKTMWRTCAVTIRDRRNFFMAIGQFRMSNFKCTARNAMSAKVPISGLMDRNK